MYQQSYVTPTNIKYKKYKKKYIKLKNQFNNQINYNSFELLLLLNSISIQKSTQLNSESVSSNKLNSTQTCEFDNLIEKCKEYNSTQTCEFDNSIPKFQQSNCTKTLDIDKPTQIFEFDNSIKPSFIKIKNISVNTL